MLTLTTHGAPATPPRSLIPPCLQPRAPHSYELFDETGNRLQPTLSGYKLKPGHSYYLKVRSPGRRHRGLEDASPGARSQVDSNKDDYVEGDRRVIQFHVEARHFWEQFASRISMLPVHLEHADGRELYRFEIPVVLTLHWSMWAISLLGLICAAVLPGRRFDACDEVAPVDRRVGRPLHHPRRGRFRPLLPAWLRGVASLFQGGVGHRAADSTLRPGVTCLPTQKIGLTKHRQFHKQH